MNQNLRILIVEAGAADAELLERELLNAGVSFVAERAFSDADFANALRNSPPEIVLADCALPAFNSLAALHLLRHEHPDLPFLCVSRAIDAEAVAELMKHGATAFVSRERLAGLAPAIRRALGESAEKRERRRAEVSLRDSDSRFRAVFEGASTGIAVEDLQGRIVETNRALQQMLGYSADELRQLTRRDLAHSHDHKEEDEQHRRLLCGKSDHYQAEKRFVRKDGRIIWGQLTVSMVRDTEGRPQFPLAMIEDITERQQTEDALLQYAAIIESSNDAIVGNTFDGIIISWNPAAGRLYGYNSSEASGRAIAMVIPPDKEEEFSQILDRIKQGERIDNFETIRRRKDGGLIQVSVTISPIKDASGKIVAASTIARDITERKRAEAENLKLAAFAQYNPNPVLELAADGTVNYSNDAARHMAQSLGKPQLSEFLPPDTVAIVKECLATGKNRARYETIIHQRSISWSFYPVQNSGVVHCYAGDITERQNLEAQLRQSQKMESVGQLAGGIAHDFNNILTVIAGHSSLLSMTPNLPETALDSAQQIAIAADRAANLTRQLLTFSRRQIIQPKNVDLNEVVNNMTKMLRRLLGEDVVLQVNYAPNLPSINADPGMMEQILLNLSVNARDAMPGGGRLVINTSVVQLDEAAASQAPGVVPGEYVCLIVTDTGSGIAPENLPHIFEPFFTTKDVGKGTGLGLATVYGIVQQHRGMVKVSSKLGRETMFEIFLPALAARAHARAAQESDNKIRGGKETILIVEDEAPVRVLVRSVLERHGYRVLEANSGVDALPIWLEHKEEVRLLLTDMVMPHGVSGRELAVRLRGDKPDLKVMYTSGYSLAVVGANMMLKEGLNFLQKPYHPRKLAQAVRDCLDG